MKPVDPNALRDSVGRRVAELRIVRGLTQEELAEATGFYTRYIQSIEGGDVNLRLDSLARLATALRVPVADLFQAPSRSGADRLRPPPRRRRT